MDSTQGLRDWVSRFVARNGIKPTNFSTAAVNDPSWYRNFIDGAEITVRMMDRVKAAMEGFSAAMQGRDLSEVPYMVPTEQATSWANGFKLFHAQNAKSAKAS